MFGGFVVKTMALFADHVHLKNQDTPRVWRVGGENYCVDMFKSVHLKSQDTPRVWGFLVKTMALFADTGRFPGPKP